MFPRTADQFIPDYISTVNLHKLMTDYIQVPQGVSPIHGLAYYSIQMTDINLIYKKPLDYQAF